MATDYWNFKNIFVKVLQKRGFKKNQGQKIGFLIYMYFLKFIKNGFKKKKQDLQKRGILRIFFFKHGFLKLCISNTITNGDLCFLFFSRINRIVNFKKLFFQDPYEAWIFKNILKGTNRSVDFKKHFFQGLNKSVVF